jgi:Flp pilus assembly protein TadB
LQGPSPVGARLADGEERRRRFSVQPLRRLFRDGRRVTAGADRQIPREESAQRRAARWGRGESLIVLVLVALLVLWMVSLWLIHSPTPAGAFWHDHLPHL